MGRSRERGLPLWLVTLCRCRGAAWVRSPRRRLLPVRMGGCVLRVSQFHRWDGQLVVHVHLGRGVEVAHHGGSVWNGPAADVR